MSEGQNRQINKMKQQYMELKQKVYIIIYKKSIKYWNFFNINYNK